MCTSRIRIIYKQHCMHSYVGVHESINPVGYFNCVHMALDRLQRYDRNTHFPQAIRTLDCSVSAFS